MNDQAWLAIAKTISEGKKKRIRCCKLDNSMLVSNSHHGYSAYCFRCGFRDFSPHGERSIRQVVRNLAEKDFEQARPQLPNDYVPLREAPHNAMLWPLQYGIGLDTAKMYMLGYSKKLDRVILPVYNNGILMYVQARALDGRKPKYLNQESPSRSAIFWSQEKQEEKYVPYVVLTEDILSAIKVGEVNSACSIMGTNMTAEKARKIADQYENVVIWTDSDKAGERGRSQARKQLLLQGVQMIKHISTHDDPKKHNYNAIQYALDQIDWCET